MINYLRIAVVVALLLALWRLDHVTTERDAAVTAAEQSDAKAASLRVTMRLQRELITGFQVAEAEYQKEKTDAQDEADRLRRCLADGTCGVRVNATCPGVRVGRSATAAGGSDAGAPELTAAAGWDFSALQQGLKVQRAQIKRLQKTLFELHRKCKIVGE
ncbi:lysis system i-spanin subunit Rz [uncultured Pseudomonas sp.]|uniref:lysis system i-spanin subunit Rz n=1 Tax=uncultured Pseudomonas sp. TaxID=114707 RepID=UPI0030D98C21|tara:strand:+ start:24102 stop:24581 length:480 start_codon:yes stop_codon:yes gene_type:complete